MVSIRLLGHDFQYAVEEVIRLFLNEEEITFVENEPPEKYRGIFILSRVEKLGNDNSYRITTKFEAAGNMHFENSQDIEISESALTEKNGHEARKNIKREVKRQLYTVLSRYTGKELPWGVLTGIRPAKIVHEMFEGNLPKTEILNKLRDYYKVSGKKSDLVYEVAENERGILSRNKPDLISIYIGIPFCNTRCLYCSFTSNPINKCKHLVDGYLEALKKEISDIGMLIKKKALNVQNIYIGGGTPTSLEASQLNTLLEFIEAYFDLSKIEEYTLEAGRPDSINEEKLVAIKNSQVNRISINPQTMNDETLKLIGRSHTSHDIIEAFKLARKIGFDNINMDLIVGLPGEGLEMFKHTLDEVRNLKPESLTVHTMSLKRASKLNKEKDNYSLTSSGEVTQMIDLAGTYAKSMDMHPYYLYRQKNILGNLENIGYCKKGFESVYNVQIMEEKQTIVALGAGAITKVVYPEENRIERAFNVKGVEEYIARLDEMVERKKALLNQ